jgi:hypothetical protein
MWPRVLRIVLAGGALAASSVVASPGTAGASHTPPAVSVNGNPGEAAGLGDCVRLGNWGYNSGWIADNETKAAAQAYAQDCGWFGALVIVSFRDANPAVQVRPNSVEIFYDYILILGNGSCTAHTRQSVVLSDPATTGLFLQNRKFSHDVQGCGETLTFSHDVLWSCLESPTHARCG